MIRLMPSEVMLTKYMPTNQKYEEHKGIQRPVSPGGFVHANQLRKLHVFDWYISWITGKAKQNTSKQYSGEVTDISRRYWILKKEEHAKD